MCRILAISRQHELAVVMPVYNEEGCIGRVVSAWRDMFRASGIDFVMLVINDGSSDRTGEILLGLATDDRIRVISQANRGHGPTILGGYRQAVQLAEWVFQCDSDDEMSPDSFAGLWEVRRQADAVFGCRQGRRQSFQRKAISLGSRLAVDILFGRGVRDVNTPYRLIRTSVLRPVLDSIPSDAFAPNLVITGALNLSRGRVLSVPVPFQPRQSGHVSIVRWGLWKAAFRSFWQTVCCSRRIRRQENLRGHASSAPSCEHE